MDKTQNDIKCEFPKLVEAVRKAYAEEAKAFELYHDAIKHNRGEMDKERDCNLCLWATRDGGCASWECEFVSKADAYEAFQMVKSPAKMIEYLRQTSMKGKHDKVQRKENNG